MNETLHGVPVPDEIQLRQAIEGAMRPLVKNWDARSQDMLDVLADSSLARAEVGRAVRTIRVVAWLGLLGLVLAALSVWTVLENDRIERRAFRAQDERARSAAVVELSRRLASVCEKDDAQVVPAPGRSKGPPGAR